MTNKSEDNPAEFGLQFKLSSGEERTFSALPICIGRSNENDLVIDQDTVSAYHAQILFDDRIQAVCIQDLGSLNGLLIDGKPTCMNVLSDGMKISVGDMVIEYHDTGYIHDMQH